MEIEPNPIRELMDIISADIYELSIQKGSAIPELQEMLDSPEYANIPLEDKEELRRDIWMRKIEYTLINEEYRNLRRFLDSSGLTNAPK